MLVQDLCDSLLAAFPLEDAESWDHVGLSVGNPADDVAGVACALDASLANVRAARELGANVLLAHHPVYISAPEAFTPPSSPRPACGAVVYEAARSGISVISLHTNLDRSLAARHALPALAGLSPWSSLEHSEEPGRTGLGALCDLEAPCLLGSFAGVLASAFDTEPRVWGSSETELSRIAFLGGSLGGFGDSAIAAGAQVVVCGEAGYHVAQDLLLRGCSVVLLGHDRSEEPFTKVLADAARRAGVDSNRVRIIPGPRQWWTAAEKGVRS